MSKAIFDILSNHIFLNNDFINILKDDEAGYISNIIRKLEIGNDIFVRFLYLTFDISSIRNIKLLTINEEISLYYEILHSIISYKYSDIALDTYIPSMLYRYYKLYFDKHHPDDDFIFTDYLDSDMIQFYDSSSNRFDKYLLPLILTYINRNKYHPNINNIIRSMIPILLVSKPEYHSRIINILSNISIYYSIRFIKKLNIKISDENINNLIINATNTKSIDILDIINIDIINTATDDIINNLMEYIYNLILYRNNIDFKSRVIFFKFYHKVIYYYGNGSILRILEDRNDRNNIHIEIFSYIYKIDNMYDVNFSKIVYNNNDESHNNFMENIFRFLDIIYYENIKLLHEYGIIDEFIYDNKLFKLINNFISYFTTISNQINLNDPNAFIFKFIKYLINNRDRILYTCTYPNITTINKLFTNLYNSNIIQSIENVLEKLYLYDIIKSKDDVENNYYYKDMINNNKCIFTNSDIIFELFSSKYITEESLPADIFFENENEMNEFVKEESKIKENNNNEK